MSRAMVVFPCIAADLGGAQYVECTDRFAWITTAGGRRVRVSRKRAGNPETWTSFTLADIAESEAYT